MNKHMAEAQFKGGGVARLSLLEIISVPDKSKSKKEDTDLLARAVEWLLNRLHFQYCSYCVLDPQLETSLELLWKAEKVKGQLYRARIRVFLAIRILSANENTSSVWVDELNCICEDALAGWGYGTQNISMAAANSDVLDTVPGCAFYKKDYQSAKIPVVDLIGYSGRMNQLVTLLSGYPDCAVSLQLIMTRFTEDEKDAIRKILSYYENMVEGQSRRTGITSSDCKKIITLYQKLYDNREGALFEYNILTYGKACGIIASGVYGCMDNSWGNAMGMNMSVVEGGYRFGVSGDFLHPWKIHKRIIQLSHQTKLTGVSRYLNRVPFLVTSCEAAGFFCLPYYDSNTMAGLPEVSDNMAVRKLPEGLLDSTTGIRIGEIRIADKSGFLSLDCIDFTRHMFISGMPGTGKTTFTISLLDRLWKEQNIPFLVIEPAKTEYRAMISSIPGLKVYTPGNRTLSPFKYNPFIPPANVRLETYKTVLRTAFQAAVTMTAPLDNIMMMAIDKCYTLHGWKDDDVIGEEKQIFSVSDFIECFRNTVEGIGYVGEASNIARAGVVRLQGLLSQFDNNQTIPIKTLLSEPTVIELAAIENREEKAMISSLLLMSVQSYINANYVGLGELKNILVLEEAHVLLAEEDGLKCSDTDPSGITRMIIKNMLAEIRAYGIGMIITDQFPDRISQEVIALTDSKVIFRQVESRSRRILAECTNMSEDQQEELAVLKVGEALFFNHKLLIPEKVKLEDYRKNKNMKNTISDKLLKENLVVISRMDGIEPYPECKIFKDCCKKCGKNNWDDIDRLTELVYDYMEQKSDKRENSQNQALTMMKQISETKNIIRQINSNTNLERQQVECVIVHLLRMIKHKYSL